LSFLVVPASTHHDAAHFDLPGALLLGIGLAGLLIAISEGGEWGWGSGRLIGVAVGSLMVVGIWAVHEVHTHLPLVELKLLRNRTVLTANVTGVMAGVGMYMLLSMIIRYVQTPKSIPYGLGASVVVGGVALVPLSAASFLASKFATYLGRWLAPARLLPLGVACFGVALIVFAAARSSLWEIFVIMAIAGAGIGSSVAVMPRMIVSATPPEETASALALNQVVRTVGYSIGSALAATVLTAHTRTGAIFPANVGYTDAALLALGLCSATAIVSVLLSGVRRQRPLPRFDADEELEIEESIDGVISGVTLFEPESTELLERSEGSEHSIHGGRP
jgi:predicted MFS family arabinose efflux permease